MTAKPHQTPEETPMIHSKPSEHDFCHCGRPAVLVVTHRDLDFFFCSEHIHLATEENIQAELEAILEE